MYWFCNESTGISKAKYVHAIWERDAFMSREWVSQARNFGASSSSDYKIQVGKFDLQ